MKYSENFDEEFSQPDEKKSDIYNNDKARNYEDNQNNYLDHNNEENLHIKKNNRTLQYYKFLFYTMKTEIKIHDFLKLLRNTNTLELTLWSLSIVLFANVPKNFPILKKGEKNTTKYSGVFLWLHICHIIRACLGMYMGYKLPRSFQIMDFLQQLSNEKLAKNIFNDIIRETLFNKVILAVKKIKIHIFCYFIITIINVVIDIIEFFWLLVNIGGVSSNAKAEFMTYMFINIIYLILNFSYFFYFGQLKYIFPSIYLDAINSLYICVIDTAKTIFKLKKDKTDVIEDNKARQRKGPYVTGSNDNGGVNLLEYIIKDSFGFKGNKFNSFQDNSSNKYLPNVNYGNENNIDNKSGISGNFEENIGNRNFPNSNEIMN